MLALYLILRRPELLDAFFVLVLVTIIPIAAVLCAFSLALVSITTAIVAFLTLVSFGGAGFNLDRVLGRLSMHCALPLSAPQPSMLLYDSRGWYDAVL
jgi:hypothetical protein